MDAFLECLRPQIGRTNAKTIAISLATLSLLYASNKLLSDFALNWEESHRDWSQEIIIITGGSSGIGALLVRKLASNRMGRIIAVDVNPPTTPLPTDCRFYQLDVTSASQIHDVANQICQEVGDPTILVNNAGVASLKPILEESEQEIRRTFDVNIVAHFLLVKELLPCMIQKNHGHIVTIASMASYVTVSSNVDYCCSKAAALSFHEGLIQELKHVYKANKVCASAVHPMWIRTPMFETSTKGVFKDTLLAPDFVADAIVSHLAAGKSGQVFLPSHFSLAAGVRGFPTWIQEWVRSSRAHLF